MLIQILTLVSTFLAGSVLFSLLNLISIWSGKNFINAGLTKGSAVFTTLVISVLLAYNTLLLHLATNGGNYS